MERFLYRLAQSRHADKFILKGAVMFTAWGAPASRATRDIDLLARPWPADLGWRGRAEAALGRRLGFARLVHLDLG